ncbi:MAG TPA: carboxypeptidase regulatory-like domain-containing protein [Steroidobacteraceae bacterium]|nr:carboxypeptidase regulatory-like domain-containing protein [Steroidobacteraceae bacterium]
MNGKQLPVLVGLVFTASAFAATHGRVSDLNGAPLAQAMVTLTKSAQAPGATATTVFTGSDGEFSFPANTPPGTVQARLLNYQQLGGALPVGAGALTVLMRPEANQAGTAPASAYLKDMKNPAHREALVMTCVACHQLPAPEVRAYAKLLDDTPSTQSADSRELAWTAIVKQMNYVSNVEFGRAGNLVPSGENVYSGGAPGPTAKILTEALRGPMQEVRGYSYGAPLIVTPRTTIREFEVAPPNAVREAVPFKGTDYLYAADVSSNRLFRIDTRTGAVKDYPIPGKEVWGPHTLVPGADGIWASPFFPGALTRFDPRTEQWKLWRLNQPGGPPVGLHDMSFDANHELATDHHGRVWFSDIVNNAVGWLDPVSGKTGEFKIPPVVGRTGGEQVYGLAMSPDRTHIWYCQLGIASFGSFNTETLKFETHVEFASATAGPRRMSMSDDGVLYLALYGAGQLAAYDTKAGRMIGIFDLPDRASAPYATSWDPIRKVVWIPTSNADVIYQFDPRTRRIGVLPLPRERGFLRMVHVDLGSGALVSSYANIVEQVRGPRMALLIDLGDGAVKNAEASR